MIILIHNKKPWPNSLVIIAVTSSKFKLNSTSSWLYADLSGFCNCSVNPTTPIWKISYSHKPTWMDRSKPTPSTSSVKPAYFQGNSLKSWTTKLLQSQVLSLTSSTKSHKFRALRLNYHCYVRHFSKIFHTWLDFSNRKKTSGSASLTLYPPLTMTRSTNSKKFIKKVSDLPWAISKEITTKSFGSFWIRPNPNTFGP